MNRGDVVEVGWPFSDLTGSNDPRQVSAVAHLGGDVKMITLARYLPTALKKLRMAVVVASGCSNIGK